MSVRKVLAMFWNLCIVPMEFKMNFGVTLGLFIRIREKNVMCKLRQVIS